MKTLKTNSIFYFILLLALIVSCKNEPHKKEPIPVPKEKIAFSGYTIQGKLKSNNELNVYLLDESLTKLDSTLINNNAFSLQGKVDQPELYFLSYNGVLTPFIIENTSFNVVLNDYSGVVYGGDLNSKKLKFKYEDEVLSGNQSKYYNQLVNKDIDLRKYLDNIDSLHKIQKKNLNKFILDNENNVLSKDAINQNDFTSKEIEKFISKIDSTKNPSFFNHLKIELQNILITEAENKILRRPLAPLFSGVNLSGSTSSLEVLMNGKKAFLIDFWASWCPPCRESSPRIRRLYNKYYAKGFDVLTVSEDRSVNDWKNGIYVDEIESWNHIYDDYNRISNLYKVTSLPHLVLIDENGKIIKNKISLNDLELELEKIFNP